MPLRPRASSQPGKASSLLSIKAAETRPRALSSRSKTALEDELSCPVCCEIFTDPVVLKCSHSFCKNCLQQFWNKKAAKRECPVCRSKCSLQEPTVSLALKNVCETLLKEQGLKGSSGDAQDLGASGGAGGGGGLVRTEELCPTHGEPVKLYCREDTEVMCCVCQTSKKHQGHNICPVVEAAQDLKVRLKEEKTVLLIYSGAKSTQGVTKVVLLKQTKVCVNAMLYLQTDLLIYASVWHNPLLCPVSLSRLIVL